MNPTSEPNSSSHNVAQNRQRLSKMLQLHGYSACKEALVLLEDHFTSSTKYESMEDFISKLNRTITFETDASSSVIDTDLAYQALQKLLKASKKQSTPTDGDIDNEIVSENDQPQIPTDLVIKVKNVHCEPKPSATNTTDKQASEFNIHYNFLLKKLLSLPIFQGDFQLTTLTTLLGSSQPSIRCICFGLLIKDISKIDGFMLIDSTGRVPVRITPDTTFRNRLAYKNCLVLLEGVYVNPDDILFAANIGLPPVLLDPLLDKSLACQSEKMVVILRELYLDDEDVCKALDMLFTGYNSMEDPPSLFILIGDFTRRPCETDVFRKHMKNLIRILRTCDNLRQCHFVFVPGQSDSMTTLPSRQESTIPKNNTHNMPKPALAKEQMPMNLLQLSNFTNIHLATNPTHIYLGERLISVVAHSYIKELRKNLLHDLSDHRDELFETCKQIMLSNAHLEAGISKSFHSSTNLWHKPDLLILADTEAFGSKYDFSLSSSNDASFATLPSFSRQYNQFKVYYVKSGEVEDSQVSTDAYQDIEENNAEPEVQLIEEERSSLD